MKAVGINQQRNAEVRFITFFLYSFPYSSIQSFPFSPSRPLSFHRLFLLFSTWFFRFSFFFSLFPSHLIFPFPLPFLSIPSSFLPFICFSFILSVLPLFFSSKSSSFLYLSSFVSFLCSFISSFLYFFVSSFIRSVISLFLYFFVPSFTYWLYVSFLYRTFIPYLNPSFFPSSIRSSLLSFHLLSIHPEFVSYRLFLPTLLENDRLWRRIWHRTNVQRAFDRVWIYWDLMSSQD